MLKTRSVLLAKTEVTYNTDSAPVAGTDAILVENLSISYEGARKADRSATRPSLGKLKSLFAGTLIGVSFDVEIKGSGAAGTAPEIAPLLRACACTESIIGSTSVAYTPASTAHQSVTFYLFEDGLRYVMTGARGKVTCALGVATAGKLSFNFVGHLVGPTDVALPSPTYNAQVPVVVINAPFTIDSFAAVITKLDFDLGIEIAQLDNIAAADGYGVMTITGRNVSGSIDPEATLVASYDWITKWKSSASYALTTGVIGATAGNRYKVDMPAVVYTEIGFGDRSGVVSRSVKFQAVETTGDNEFTLIFT